jgi:hypothetical protein
MAAKNLADLISSLTPQEQEAAAQVGQTIAVCGLSFLLVVAPADDKNRSSAPLANTTLLYF